MKILNFSFQAGLDSARKWQQQLRHTDMGDYTIFSLFAILIGLVTGTGAVLFHKSLEWLIHFFFYFPKFDFYRLRDLGVILIPALGMALQSLLILSSPLIAKKKGVGEVIKAVASHSGFLPFRTTVFHFIAPLICMGTGGTVGPEGPVAQLGGGLASKVSQIFSLSDSRRRLFTAAGAGSAIAAVFNTPLGGIFFTFEVILLNEFQSIALPAFILASVAASAISRIFLGNAPTFIFNTLEIGPYSQLYLFVILGIIAGFLSLLYIEYSNAVRKLFKDQILIRIPQWLSMVLVGLLVGIAGYFYHDIFGIGYSAINKILSHQLTWKITLILLLLKFVLVPLILSSGGFGGIFAPSLFMGAGAGYLYAVALNSIWGLQLDPTAYTLVGMGAVLGGINSIPITAILIIFEMTRAYTFILPLMLSVVISTTLVQLIYRDSIHLKQLRQQGFSVTPISQSSPLKLLKVSDILQSGIVLIPEQTPLPILINKLTESPYRTCYTVNQHGELVGTITENDLRPIITEFEHLRKIIVARDIARETVVTVNEHDDLELVIQLFGDATVDEFPVVAADNPKQVIGTIQWQALISAYNQASLKHDAANSFTRKLKTIEKLSQIQVTDGYSILARKVPAQFVGKTLAQLRMRSAFGLEVLMIKPTPTPFGDQPTPGNCIFPCSDYILQATDELILFGGDDNIAATRNWE
ncbi:chloride channel protein [candidate division KSB1 bacterium]|nr:chloride channel protein [candidate division KSB1 bacterium]